MQAGDIYEKSAMDALALMLQNNRFQPDVQALVYAILSIRATLKAQAEIMMDAR